MSSGLAELAEVVAGAGSALAAAEGASSAVELAAVVAACAGVLGLRRDQAPSFPHRAHVVKAGISCPTCHRGIETALHDLR